jgi:glycosyltransferase domain-containing protein
MTISKEMIDWFESELSSIQPDENLDDLGELKNLTVIIPTYERQTYLLRQVLYWAGSGVTLIIVDGSKLPFTKLEQLGVVDELNFQYIHCPESFPHRLALAGGMILTPYAVLLGDDEFHLKSGLIAAIKSMVRDPSLAACIGQSLGFSLKGGALKLGAGYPHSHYRVMEDKVSDRLNTAMAAYNAATCYSVLTKNAWISSWGDLQACSCPYAEEMEQAFSTYISGKLSSVQAVYWMRSYDEPLVNILGEYDRTLTFSSWWKGKAYKQETEGFVNRLANKLVAADGAESLVHARKILNEAIESYIASSEQRNSGSLLRYLFRKASGTIRQKFNYKFIEQINYWLSKSASIFFGHDHLLNFGSIAELQASVAKDDLEKTEILVNELERVQRLVVEHSRHR